MPILKFITDDKPISAKLIGAVSGDVAKNKVSAAATVVIDKAELGRAIELWTVPDQAKALKAKDSKQVALGVKMDPKKKLGDYGVKSANTVIYVKKKGAPPHTPGAAASPSDTSKSAQPTPKESPKAPPPPPKEKAKAAPPPPPAAPKETPAAKAAPPAPTPPAPKAPPPAPTPAPDAPASTPPPAPPAAQPAPKAAAAPPPPSKGAVPPPPAPAAPAAPTPAAPPAAGTPLPPPPTSAAAVPVPAASPADPSTASPQLQGAAVGLPMSVSPPGVQHVQAFRDLPATAAPMPRGAAGGAPGAGHGGSPSSAQRARETTWGRVLQDMEEMRLERAAEKEAHARLLLRERISLREKAMELRGIQDELQELTSDALCHLVSNMRASASPRQTQGGVRSPAGLGGGGGVYPTAAGGGGGAALPTSSPSSAAQHGYLPVSSQGLQRSQPVSLYPLDGQGSVEQRLEHVTAAARRTEEELARLQRMPPDSFGGGGSPVGGSRDVSPRGGGGGGSHRRQRGGGEGPTMVDMSYFTQRQSPRQHRVQQQQQYASPADAERGEVVDRLAQQMYSLPRDHRVSEGEVNDAFAKMLHLRSVRDKALLCEMEATQAMQGLGVAASALPTTRGTAAMWKPESPTVRHTSPLYGSPRTNASPFSQHMVQQPQQQHYPVPSPAASPHSATTSTRRMRW